MKEDFRNEHMKENFPVVSTNTIEGSEIIEYVGIVQGSTVRSRNFGSDIFATLKNLVGGELVGYSKLLQASRDQAYHRMLEDAKAKGANAIICFRFQTSTITQGASEILAYGTGVKINK
jgi:uncharacterized protein YbjQ (UPF0145 family)